ncbi:MAG: hypothetical protein U0836_20620 [Pirellulales bacterium]
MSDASFEVPGSVDVETCCECGACLTREELDAGREVCFACYVSGQDWCDA